MMFPTYSQLIQKNAYLSVNIYPSRNDKGNGAEDFLEFFKDIRSRDHNKFQAR